jgi:hypothetical protein
LPFFWLQLQLQIGFHTVLLHWITHMSLHSL